jgi:hypothetical protein
MNWCGSGFITILIYSLLGGSNLPASDDFLLLDGEDFFLLDDTNFLLLGE